jgi:hypothetical protein
MSEQNQTNELASALAKAQALFTNPERNREVKVTMKGGGSYVFKYATLDSIMDMVRGPLGDNGLAITHIMSLAPDGWVCAARLLHASGQSVECPVPILVSQDANAQAWGSAITYAKRYGLCALLAITAEEDNDGNGACGNDAEPVVRKKPTPDKPKSGFTPPPPAVTGKPSWDKMDDTQRKSLVLGTIAATSAADDWTQGWDKLIALESRPTLKDLTPDSKAAVDLAFADAKVHLASACIERIVKQPDPVKAKNQLEAMEKKECERFSRLDAPHMGKIVDAFAAAYQTLSQECKE